MTTTTNVSQVKVNIMTQAQYDTATKNTNEFYVISDGEYLESITSGDVTGALGFTPADNGAVVHLSGSETITGNKTFSGAVALGSNATATTQTASDSSTKVATTAFVKNQGYKTTVTSSDVTTALGFTPVDATVAVTHTASTAVGSATVPVYVGTNGAVTTCTALNTAAYVADNTLMHLAGAETVTGNKTFSGTVSLGSSASATTQTASDNSTKVATTAFVKNQGYKTTVTSSDVTGALGFTPVSASIQTLQDIQNNGASGSLSLSNTKSIYKITPTASTTISFGGSTSASSSIAYTFELMLDMSSTAYAITWPTITWQNNEIPDLSEAGVYFFAFRTVDGGTTWYGNLQGKW